MQTELPAATNSAAALQIQTPDLGVPGWVRPLLEVALVVASLELVLFPLHDGPLRALTPIPLLLLLVVAWRSARRTGWTVRPGLIDVQPATFAWIGIVLATLAGAMLFTGLADWLDLMPNGDSKVSSRGLLHWLGRKFPTVAIQQFGLQLFVLPASLEIFRRRWQAVSFAAGVFAVIHLPNLPLMTLTFVAGLVWCSLFLWSGRLAPLIVSHLALAVLASELAGHSLYHMRVGAGCAELLPYEIAVESGEPLTVTPEALVGSVDACRPVAQGLECRGWVLDRRRPDPVNRLVVVVDGQVHRFELEEHRHPNRDASQLYGTREQELCGFHIPMPHELLSGAESIEFFGETDDGSLSRMTPPRNMRMAGNGAHFD